MGRSPRRSVRPHSSGGRRPHQPHLAQHPHRHGALRRDTHPVLPGPGIRKQFILNQKNKSLCLSWPVQAESTQQPRHLWNSVAFLRLMPAKTTSNLDLNQVDSIAISQGFGWSTSIVSRLIHWGIRHHEQQFMLPCSRVFLVPSSGLY